MAKYCVGFLVLLSVLCNAQEKRTLPQVSLKDLKGEVVFTDEITNSENPILIIIWATWCHHAVDGMSNIADDYFETWVEDFNLKIVTVSIDDARNVQKVAPLVYGKGWEFEHYLDPNADFKRAMGVNQPPHLFILNGKRQIVWSLNSFNPGDEEVIQQQLESLMSQTSNLK